MSRRSGRPAASDRLGGKVAFGRRVHGHRIAAAQRHVDLARRSSAPRRRRRGGSPPPPHRTPRRASVRMVPRMTASPGIWLAALPASIVATVITTASSGSTLRETIVCSAKQQMRRGHHRVARQMRQGGVAGTALDAELDASARGHHGAVVHRDGAGFEARPVVVAEDPLHREALEQAVGDHALRAAAAFLGRLEHEVHRAGPRRVLLQQRRGAEQRGGMAVMAAGVHHARIARGIGAGRWSR